ncbi:MAG: FKBP-type peptidyl-prolyl cis-trans isomerase [Gemmatimonadales bacterium]
MKRTAARWSAALGLATLVACGDGIVAVEDTKFASSLGIDLAQMTKTSSGLYYQDVTVGTGALAAVGKLVSVHYIGWLADATQFDINQPPTTPLRFTVGSGQVISGFDEGVFQMQVGGRRKIVIPPNLGYGASGAGPIPPNAVLVFQVDLVAVQ